MGVRSRAQKLLRGVGLNVTRTAHLLEHKRAALLRDTSVNVVLDVGANWGGYAEELRARGYSQRIISFEPLSEPYATLNALAAVDPRWETHRVALGRADRMDTIHVSANTVSSSLLPVTGSSIRAEPSSAAVRSEQVQVRSLNSLQADILQPRDRVFLKLDVQGFEGEVLAGADRVLPQVVGVECELSLVPLYAGQPLMGEMLTRLETLGFQPIWIERGFTDARTGYMLQADALLIRSESSPD
jgi:FkbM family methyltransferase